ncbi:galactose-binding domain-like protein [Hyaloscypha sp. PMI_1271]|nr:galactose-binding domain-like protein [Hyaloscypha sp. PMI_1271]
MGQVTEITGHVVARLSISIAPEDPSSVGEKDMDLFLTLGYIATSGDPVPLAKRWLRIRMRKVDKKNPRNWSYTPHRNYFSTDFQELEAGQVYTVDVEIWPTNVIAEKGGRVVEVDRPRSQFPGMNNIHFEPGLENYVTLPLISEKE